MVESQTELESKTLDLTTEAFSTFAEDIAMMFDTGVNSLQSDIEFGTVKNLKEKFKKLVAVCGVRAEGEFNGDFFIVFDSDGLFTLAGTFVMQPEQVIQQNRKSGTKDEADEIGDALGEVGNLLVGSWDRVFREELEGHKHFIQNGTFIGNPWSNPVESINMAADAELNILTYEIGVDPLPPFKCAAVYPKALFEQEEEVPPEEAEETTAEATTEEESAEEQAPGEEVSHEKPEEKLEETAEEAPAEKAVVQETAVDQTASDEIVSEAQAFAEQPSETERPVSEAIRKITESEAVLPGGQAEEAKILNSVCAQDIMRKDVVWGNPDESVEQLIAKMQQHDSAYVLIGNNGILEGIVSKSDIRGALSPYLQSMFAKWRSSMDVASLQIKAKWAMSRPVRTVRPDANILLVMKTMSEHGGRCMPVVDQEGVVKGTVTVFDVFHALITYGNQTSSSGNTAQSVPVV